MPVCPKCHSEYREGFEQCAHCEVALVAELPEAGEDKAERLREAAAKGEAMAIMRASYADACQVVETLQESGLDAMVSGDPKSCGKGGQCSHFFVTILPEDAEAAGRALKTEFRKLLDPEQATVDPEATVDFDAEGAHACPACGAHFEGQPETCPECELFLGVG